MSRIRSIHPRIFTDEHYASLSIYARELLKGLWCEAWDDGVVEWRPMRLKMRIFPLDTVDVEALLAELVREKFIMHLDAGGKEFAVIRNFRKWQKPKKPMASGVLPDHLLAYIGLKPGESAGKVYGVDQPAPPAPGDDEDHDEVGAPPVDAPPVENRFRTGGEIPRQKGGREEGRKVEGSLRSPPPRESATGTPAAPVGEGSSSNQPEDGDFQAFWAAYPTEARTAPDYARRAYAKARQLGATPAAILSALAREAARCGARGMLAPAAWLKGGSWRMAADEPPRAAAPVASDARLAGFGIEDHMALGQWREARANAWRTRSAAHNAMPEDERRLALWDKIEGYRPLVARFLLAHEPAGTEQGESLPV